MPHINQRADIQARSAKSSSDAKAQVMDEECSCAQLVFLFARYCLRDEQTVIEVQVGQFYRRAEGARFSLATMRRFHHLRRSNRRSAITMFMLTSPKNLLSLMIWMAHLLAALGAKVERVIITT